MPPSERQPRTGWGRTTETVSRVERPATTAAVAEAIARAPNRGVLARGLGRSYGDAAQNAGGTTLEDIRGAAAIRLDEGTGVVTASAGLSIDAVLAEIVPRGWFVPVTPGTRQVTLGGALAADIHGKNHHLDGSWSMHVLDARLALADGSTVVVSQDADPDLFWATAGGMGLTGVITEMRFQALPIVASTVLVDTDRATDLDELMGLMEEGDAAHRYSVAWLDVLARGPSLGRGVLTRGDFAADAALGLDYRTAALASAPSIVPSGLLNRATVSLFNEAWFRRSPRHRRAEPQSIARFFHPLDGVAGWNRLYGPRGFFQWQCVVPFGAETELRGVIERVAAARCPSFLSVLKRFGAAAPGPLSFPLPGWTLTLDVPAGADPAVRGLFDDLDERVASAGGRIYLAKDSRLRPELLDVMYPRLDEWRAVRARVDPQDRFRSDLARRLGL